MSCPTGYTFKEHNGELILCERKVRTPCFPKKLLQDPFGNIFAHQYMENNLEMCVTKKNGPFITCDVNNGIYKAVDIILDIRTKGFHCASIIG